MIPDLSFSSQSRQHLAGVLELERGYSDIQHLPILSAPGTSTSDLYVTFLVQVAQDTVARLGESWADEGNVGPCVPVDVRPPSPHRVVFLLCLEIGEVPCVEDGVQVASSARAAVMRKILLRRSSL